MSQHYSDNKAVRLNDGICLAVSDIQQTSLESMLYSFREGKQFASLINEMRVIDIIDRINARQLNNDLDTLIGVLKNFNTWYSFADLAKLIFNSFLSCEVIELGKNDVLIKLVLTSDDALLITQNYENLITQSDELLSLYVRGSQQQRNDYEYLVKYLGRHNCKYTFEYNEE